MNIDREKEKRSTTRKCFRKKKNFDDDTQEI